MKIYMEEGSERNISSAKLASPFQTVMMKKTALHALLLACGVRPRLSTINVGNVSDVLLKIALLLDETICFYRKTVIPIFRE